MEFWVEEGHNVCGRRAEKNEAGGCCEEACSIKRLFNWRQEGEQGSRHRERIGVREERQ